MLIGLSGPRHHSASVSFIQNPISRVFQNLHCFLHPPFYASSNASNICSPSISLPRPEPFLPASSFDHCLSPLVGRGVATIYLPSQERGRYNTLPPCVERGEEPSLLRGRWVVDLPQQWRLSKVCAHNKLCSSVQSIDLPLRQGEREKKVVPLSLCFHFSDDPSFPQVSKGYLKSENMFRPFSLFKQTYSE